MSDSCARPFGTEWRAAWPLPFVSAIGYAAAVTHIYSLGLFIEPIEAEFGWSRSAIALGLTISSSVSVVLGAFIGLLVDRWGPRRVALPGMVFYCSMLGALSLAGPAIGSWQVLWIFLGVGGACIQPVVWTAAVAARFDRTRGLALAITMSGGGFCTAVAPIVANLYIGELGWRGAYLALAGTLAVVALPLIFLLFRVDSPVPVARGDGAGAPIVRMGLRQALLSGRFLRLVLISLVMTASMMAMVVHFVPILTSGGLDRTTAAAAAGAIGISSMVGRLCGGIMLDKLSGPTVAAAIFALPILATALLLWTDVSATIAFIAAILLGLAVGGEVDVLAYMTSRYFSLNLFGTLFAIVSVFGSVGVGLGPLVGGLIFDWSTNYDLLLLAVMPASALAVILAASMGTYPGPPSG